MFLNIPESFEIKQSTSEYSGRFENIPEYCGIF